MKSNTRIGTWNIHGKLTDSLQQELLERDMQQKNIDVCCIQETRMITYAEILCPDGGMIINIKAEAINMHKRYGMGFYINNKWLNRLQGYRRLTDRISVINFRIHRR